MSRSFNISAGRPTPQVSVAGGGSGTVLLRCRPSFSSIPVHSRNGGDGCAPVSLGGDASLQTVVGVSKGAHDSFPTSNLFQITNQFVGHRANGDPDISTAFVSIAFHDPDHGDNRCEQIRGHQLETFAENGK